MTSSNAAAALSGATPAPAASDATANLAGNDPAASAAVQQTVNNTQAANDWVSSIQDPAIKTWVEAKGWKDPAGVAASAYNLEKLIGFDKAGKTIKMIDDKSTPEDIAAFRNKMGVPEKVDGYKFPEGFDADRAKKAASWFHEAGLNQKQADQLITKLAADEQGLQSQYQRDLDIKISSDLDALQKEWGQAFGERAEVGKRGAATFLPDMSPEDRQGTIAKMMETLGVKKTYELFYNIGNGLSEHKMHSGSAASRMTPAEARQKQAELMSNKDWAKAYLGGDQTKNKELQDLISIMNSGG